ncbi:AraC family transcriptional regulator [Salmonella enterica]|nr:AraC family transcriptional regulator [Salmonella enterica]
MKPARTPELWDFDGNDCLGPVAGMKIGISMDEILPFHVHRHGQLVMSLSGAVTCEVVNQLWMVPPQCCVWIPGDMPHSIRATTDVRLCMLFIDPVYTAELPLNCCTISVSPLVRELILDITEQSSDYVKGSLTFLKASVLLEELNKMPIENFCLPISKEPRLTKIIDAWLADPSDRRTLTEWSKFLSMSSRTLSRLVVKETGLTFGKWHRQLHLNIAMRYLSRGDTVQRVANDLGYDSVNAFITMFKKLAGKPPGRYFADRDLN